MSSLPETPAAHIPPGTGRAGGAGGATGGQDDRRTGGLRGWRADGTGLRGLTWLGIAVPILFLVAIESFRFIVIEDDPVHRAEHVAIASITAIGVVVFAVGMFGLVRRAERRIVRQNRELTAINAVTTAVQGELAVEQILDAALQTVVDRTGATEASVVVFAHDGQPDTGLERTLVVAPHASPDAIGSDELHLIDIPLSRGQTVVGRLRLHLPRGVDEPDLLTSATLQNIGHQLACSIQIGQLVTDLQRRRAEGHALYDVLLRISNQRPLTDVLGAIVRHARDLLHADDAVIWLNPATSAHLQLASAFGMAASADGTVCIGADPARFDDPERRSIGGAAPEQTAGAASVQATLVSPRGSLGELRAVRGAELPFTGRERGYVQTLAELAGIAISSAWMRENERQGAILAERDRIAREMHDSLAQVLGATHLRLRALGAKLGTVDAPTALEELVDLANLTEDAYRDVREAILGLRESSHADRGLLESLRAYLDRYSSQSGVRATLESDLVEVSGISPAAEVQVIRVIQEALANVRKHAHVASATVRVESDESWVTFSIEDLGRGFDVTATLLGGEARFGLQTMRERMTLAGGTLSIESAPGRGVRVVARVPRVRASVPALAQAGHAG